jgi:hypothetical protein
MCNKTVKIYDFILDSDVDILVITESWLGEDDPVVIGESTPSGYALFNCPRIGDKHGGLVFISKSNLKLSIQQVARNSNMYTTFEYACVSDISKSFRLIAIYRPPPSTENGFTTATFLEEFDNFLCDISELPGKPLIVGDFNLHVDVPSKPEVSHYLASLSQHDFCQVVDRPTHKGGHILDHIICHPDDDLLTDCKVSPNRYGSDHHMIECRINKLKPIPERKTINMRNFKDLDMEVFKDALSHELCDLALLSDPEEQSVQYNIRLRGILDEYCPEQIRSRKVIRDPVWFDDKVRDARRKRRRYERKWRKSLSESDHERYIVQNKIVNDLIVMSKTEYYKNTLAEADSKTMYRTVNSLLNKSNAVLPSTSSNESLSNNFANFFSEKVDKIRSELDSSILNVSCKYNDKCNDICNDNSQVQFSKYTLCNNDQIDLYDVFTPVDEDEVRKILSKIPNKSSSLDPLPTWLLKKCFDIFVPFMMSFINNSFQAGHFPSILREAVISPLIKKSTLNPDILKNYRPVSNLPTLGKILEYPAVSRLNDHLKSQDLTEKFQSAYKTAHSTETALLRVRNDIVNELDQGKIVMLVLLDMSAAFDTIDHDILVNRLNNEYGIGGCVLNWFSSYLKDRTSRVCVLGNYSSVHPLKYGVPQGSVAGPPIFTLYSKPVTAIFRHFNIAYHVYADDTQLYVSYDPKVPGDFDVVQRRLMDCIAEVKVWMLSNKLRLNDTKTEFFIINSPRQLNLVAGVKLKIGGSEIDPSLSIKNLGIIFDPHMNMDLHVNLLCRTVNFHLKNISRIRRFIDQNTCAHAVRSLVLSRLDYGNSLLGGISCSSLKRLQKLQNRAARLVYCVDRRTSAAPLLRDLHWLPVQQRINFKILLHVYNCVNSLGPSYLSDVVSLYQCARAGLRSSKDKTRLAVHVNKRAIGSTAFSHMGPRLWNDLPIFIRTASSVQSFKKLLKTHLFPAH